MRISVFGLGYVGTVCTACLADMGHDVVGVDVDTAKVDTVNRGESPIVEELIGDLVRDMVQANRVRATISPDDAVQASEISFICVGTPSTRSGSLDTGYAKQVAEQIGLALRQKNDYHVVIVRSTLLPGATEDEVIPALEEKSGKRAGKDFGVCFHPEFLREGSSVRDFRDPPKIVIGSNDTKAVNTLKEVYKGIDAPVFVTSFRAAEMVKYSDNCFHALKVVFGNEIGSICKAHGIDSHEVFAIFCADTKLNISPAYLTPGFAYGGSCLPKDLRALRWHARDLNVDVPVLDNVQRSNEAHLQRVFRMIQATEKRRVALLGLSFKQGTDDLRESPFVELAERLIGKGFQVRIHDDHVSLSHLRGRNKAFIEQALPHISEVLGPNLDAILSASDVLVLGTKAPPVVEAVVSQASGKVIVDLVRALKNAPDGCESYTGICW